MGARSLVEITDSSRTTTASSSSSASIDLSASVIGPLSVELGLEAATTQSVAAHSGKTQTWNKPTKKPTMPPPEDEAEPKTYFVKHTKVLGGGIASVTPWDLALRFRDAGHAIPNLVDRACFKSRHEGGSESQQTARQGWLRA
jgi:hypothetical protein